MKAVQTVNGRAYPLGRDNVDTDMIIRAEHMKTVVREGLGRFLFESLRQDPANPFEDPAYAGASILIAGDNFGCGSSREHAAWAIADFGIKAIIAGSFSDIFAGNAFRNRILAVSLQASAIEALMQAAIDGRQMDVDLAAQRVICGGVGEFQFEFDPFRRDCLLQGLDEIDLALVSLNKIVAFEQGKLIELPWSASGALRPLGPSSFGNPRT